MNDRIAVEHPSAERAILGAIIRDPEFYWQERGRLTPDIFAAPIHRRIVKAMHELAAGDRMISLPGLVARLPESMGDISTEGYLGTCIADDTHPEAIGGLLEDLMEARARRAMLKLGQDLIQESTAAGGQSFQERLEDAIARARAIAEDADQEAALISGEADAAVDRMLKQATDAYKAGRSDGIPWFIPELGAVTGDALEWGWLIGCLSDSGGGKTSLALQQVHMTAAAGIPVLFMSGDQPPEDCYRQMASQALGIESRRIRQGRLSDQDWARLLDVSKTLKKLPIVIRKMSRPTVPQVARVVRNFVRRHGSRVLVVFDHAKKFAFTDRRAGLSEGISQVMGDVKSLIFETGCVGLMLMQRNSEGRKRDNPRPMRGDVYGGEGTLENYDTVFALWVEERHLIQELKVINPKLAKAAELAQRLAAVEGKAELIGLKTRFSQDGQSVMIRREAQFTRFASLSTARENEEPGLPI